MIDREDNKYESWPWLNWSIVLVFVAAILIIGLISAGVFDPKPVGELTSTLALEPIDLDAGEVQLEWLPQAAPPTDHTLRLTAALTEGEVDSAYGLLIGDETQNIVVAVSPTGYVSIWRHDGHERATIMPWRTWPHIAQDFETNELWLDIEGSTLTGVRINRELLWQGALPAAGQRIGLWAETYGRPARIDFELLESFSVAPAS